MSISQCAIVGLAAASEPSIGVVVATGPTIVFFVLIMLYVLITLEGVLFKSIDNKKKAAAEAEKALKAAQVSSTPCEPTVTIATPPVVEEGISAEVVAAIAGAISCMENGENYEVRSISRVKKGRNAWSNAAVSSYTEPF